MTEKNTTSKIEKILSVSGFKGEKISFGVISDTHIGSKYDNMKKINLAYKIFKSNNIKEVYHSGDLTDGEKMYRGQEYELRLHGAKEQTDEVIKRYPKFKGVKTKYVLGNHDLSYYKRAGVDIGEMISNKRKDMIYLGQEDATVKIGDKYKLEMRLMHPGKGSSYAISYQPQKIVENISGGTKPHILLIGHFHKAEYIPNLRNVQTIQAGTLQSQTPFMARNFLSAATGFWIVDTVANKKGLVGINPTWYPFYEE